jgi:hypothetical protein
MNPIRIIAKTVANLNESFTTAPFLVLPDQTAPFILETDASDFAAGAIITQIRSDGLPHPVAFYSFSWTPAELNYDIHDKELLIIIKALKEWRALLCETQHPVTVFTDYRNLEYFLTSRTLNRRQARWSQFLVDYSLIFKYRPGNQNGAADALSRRIDLNLKSEEFTQQPLIRFNATEVIALDPFLQLVKNSLSKDRTHDKLMERKDYLLKNGLLYTTRNQLYLPPDCRNSVIRSRHGTLASGHSGLAKTMNLVLRDFYWPGLRNDIKKYVDSCSLCVASRPSRHKPY